MTEIGYDVERGFDVDFHGRRNVDVFCPFCEANGGKSPSCSVNINGFFKCHSCEMKGTVVAFYATYRGISKSQARFELLTAESERPKSLRGRAIYAEDGKKIKITESLVARTVQELTVNGRWLFYLQSRGISVDTILEHNIGCDDQRITIPIYKDGDPINIRRYLPGGTPKIVSHLCGDGTPQLYPEKALDEYVPDRPLVLCEGEWDALLLNQIGVPAITTTGGCGYWHNDFTERLKGMIGAPGIITLYDVHDKKNQGQTAARIVGGILRDAGIYVRNVELDLDPSWVGGDVTDYLTKAQRSPEALRALIYG